jgi:signal recognition particle receptor subunit beta
MLQFWLRRPRRRTAILLVGPPDGGKTSILLRLRDGSLHKGTVASTEPNEAEVSLQSDKGAFRPVRIIDVPGHPRLRGRFDALAPEAAGVIFVVDAADFMSKKAETAE